MQKQLRSDYSANIEKCKVSKAITMYEGCYIYATSSVFIKLKH